VKPILAILAFLLFVSCSGGAGTMDGIMRSWEGAPLDAAIAQWGYPDQEQQIAGHKLYRWFYTKTGVLPGTTTGTITQLGTTAYLNVSTVRGGTLVGNCTRTLEVDEHNIIIRWEWKGNNCPFAEAFEYSNWRRKVN